VWSTITSWGAIGPSQSKLTLMNLIPQLTANQVFLHYSYLNNAVNRTLDLLPPLLRIVVFRLLLGSCGRNVMIDYGCYFRYFRRIHIGSNVSINRGSQVIPSYLTRDSKIVIEDDVMIGPGVTFLGGGHNPHDGLLSDVGDSIHVRSKVFVGANATVRYGVTIGNGATVAAGAVVVDDVSSGAIVAGIPARCIN
jgi:maltose O-acetyltransferase